MSHSKGRITRGEWYTMRLKEILAFILVGVTVAAFLYAFSMEKGPESVMDMRDVAVSGSERTNIKEMASAIKGIDYLLSDNNSDSYSEYFTFLKWISGFVNDSRIYKRLKNAPHDDIYMNRSALLGKEYLEKLKENEGNYSSFEYCNDYELHVRAIYCDAVPVTALYFKYISNCYREGNYSATHAMLFLNFLKLNGCHSPESIKEVMDKTSAFIVGEQDREVEQGIFSDIIVKRTAFLLLADYGNEVKERWIKLILDNQNKDGGWPCQPYTGYIEGSSEKCTEKSNTHTTGLAVVSLLAYGDYLEGSKEFKFF